MDDDQQFCLRWNNHQSTLVSVFDNLLENSALVDCTLFAEGKYLKAHKVVLSACSPYFETLLTQQYDKHPIFILKDVKYQELKAMMDYMYRGEVNISQDQLAALLKAAESLQIKGLSDSRNKEESRKSAQPPAAAKTPPPATTPALPRVQGLTIEQRKAPKLSESLEDSRSREGSSSPVPRKRKKPRRRASQEGVNDNHDASSSSESHSNQAPVNIPSLPAVPLASTSKLTDVPEPVETKPEPVRPKMAAESSQVPIKEKQEIHSELILEPKSEYIEEEMNEDSVEDLTLDDDDVSQMEQEMDHARPGPSHGSGDGSAQGFGGWHMQGNQNQDEVFLAAQEAVGAHRDSQGSSEAERGIDESLSEIVEIGIIEEPLMEVVIDSETKEIEEICQIDVDMEEITAEDSRNSLGKNTTQEHKYPLETESHSTESLQENVTSEDTDENARSTKRKRLETLSPDITMKNQKSESANSLSKETEDGKRIEKSRNESMERSTLQSPSKKIPHHNQDVKISLPSSVDTEKKIEAENLQSLQTSIKSVEKKSQAATISEINIKTKELNQVQGIKLLPGLSFVVQEKMEAEESQLPESTSEQVGVKSQLIFSSEDTVNSAFHLEETEVIHNLSDAFEEVASSTDEEDDSAVLLPPVSDHTVQIKIGEEEIASSVRQPEDPIEVNAAFSKNPILCNHCGNIFNSRNNYNLHQLLEAGVSAKKSITRRLNQLF